MTPLELGIVGFFALTLLIYSGMHISTSLLVVSFVGTAWIRGDWSLAGKLLAQTATDAVTEYEFGTAPLFVLMGFMVMAAGVGRDCYVVAERLFGRFTGGIGQATVVGNAVFSAVTGVSIAAVVMFTRMAVPEMLKRGYPPRLAVGVLQSAQRGVSQRGSSFGCSLLHAGEGSGIRILGEKRRRGRAELNHPPRPLESPS